MDPLEEQQAPLTTEPSISPAPEGNFNTCERLNNRGLLLILLFFLIFSTYEANLVLSKLTSCLLSTSTLLAMIGNTHRPLASHGPMVHSCLPLLKSCLYYRLCLLGNVRCKLVTYLQGGEAGIVHVCCFCQTIKLYFDTVSIFWI